MQNPYDRYQKSQSKASSLPKKKVAKKTKASVRPVKKRRSVKNGPHIGMILASFMGLGLSFYIFAYTDEFMQKISQIQIGVSQSVAADGAENATQNVEKQEKDAALPVGKVSLFKVGGEHLTMKNANIYNALKDKRRELEKKERRLAQLEEELQIQKTEIEKQLHEMKEMRRNISSKLDQKVVADQESINKLVGVYASMKPKNAAVIFSRLDEDLAIKVLGKMKKQNAAAILNYVEPGKAQMLSEKFAGLKK